MLSIPTIHHPGGSAAPSIYTLADDGEAHGESPGPKGNSAEALKSSVVTQASAPPKEHQTPREDDSAEQPPNGIPAETPNERRRSDLPDFVGGTGATSRASTMFSRATQTDVDQATQTDESCFRLSVLGSTATTTAEKSPEGITKDVEGALSTARISAEPLGDPAPPPPPPSASPPKPLLGWRLVVVEFW